MKLQNQWTGFKGRGNLHFPNDISYLLYGFSYIEQLTLQIATFLANSIKFIKNLELLEKNRDSEAFFSASR